jgi:hypothetical protein
MYQRCNILLPGFFLFETRVNEDDLDSDDSRKCGVVIRDLPVIRVQTDRG